ncbi:MAG: patatin-like phospholipase family protein [Solirubrobacteraceae bacterium]
MDEHEQTPSSALRIALTISGAVSLGAYEGGALAALLVALKKLGERLPDRVVVDAIAGASAGSMTAVLTAKGLLTHADPVQIMYTAWVEAASLGRMKAAGATEAPLSMAQIRTTAEQLLGELAATGDGAPQRTPIRVEFALGALRGLNYTFRRLGRPPIAATSYMDWYRCEFSAASDPATYCDAISPAFASGAHALAFPAELLVREIDRSKYERNGVNNFPKTGALWYTDGGTIDNQPLGRALDMTDELDRSLDGCRLHLVIIPDPSIPAAAKENDWADPATPPKWLPTVARAGKMAMTQTLYDDLRRAEKRNSRLEWSAELSAVLSEHLHPDAASALARLIARFDAERVDLGAHSKGAVPREGEVDGDAQQASSRAALKDLVREAMAAATGLQGKQPVAIDAVSPLLLAPRDKAELKRLLSGDRYGHFFGFLHPQLRSRDFALGYRCMLAWLDDSGRGLRTYGIPDDHVRAAVQAAQARYEKKWEDEPGFTVGGLPRGSWPDVRHVMTRTSRLLVGGLAAWSYRRRKRAARNGVKRVAGKLRKAAARVPRPWR